MWYKRLLSLTIFCLSLLWLPSAIAETDKVVEISTGDYSPWTDQKAQYGGFVNRVVREAFSRKGYLVKFYYRPWKRALLLAQNGKVDASSFWFLSDEKKKIFIYSDPISEHKELFFHLASKKIEPWDSLTDLKELKIGATRGYTYTEEFWRLGEDGILTILETNSDKLNFKKLLAGRIDIFPAAEQAARKVIKSLDGNALDKLATLEKPLARQFGHLVFPKSKPQSEKLLALFNEALKSMKEDGTFDSYYQDMLNDIY